MSKTENQEPVKVTVNVPKGLMQFLEDNEANNEFDSIQDYMEDAIIDRVQADINAGTFNPTVKDVAKKYGLEEAFGVS